MAMMTNWQPTANLAALQARAGILKNIRSFFETRNVLEVETPILGECGVTDLYLENVKASALHAGKDRLFLQTSPEYYMKRLLAFGSGCIYQIVKAFRDEQIGPYHQVEFSMLEWYRLNFTHHQLMKEVDELLQLVLECGPAKKLTYQELFLSYLNVCPFESSVSELAQIAKDNKITLASELNSKDEWLFLLLSYLIEPKLAHDEPLFVYDYPVSQASLARLNDEKNRAHRFEVYFKGVELANGFWELTDVNEQKMRFAEDLALRKSLGKESRIIDKSFIEALEQGLPNCSGVALGLDRLIMLALNVDKLDKVISFAMI